MNPKKGIDKKEKAARKYQNDGIQMAIDFYNIRAGIIIAAILLMGFAITHDSVHAYYSTCPDGETEPGFKRQMNRKAPGENPNLLVLYDNMNRPPQISSNQAIIFSRSEYFVPADLIDCNLSIYPLLHNKLEPGRALNNLVHANMKIYLLLEDYKQLKERSRELLEDLGIPYLESLRKKAAAEKKTNKGKKTGKSDSEKKLPDKKETKKIDSEESSEPSVAAAFKALKRQARSTSGMLQQKEAEDDETDALPGLGGEHFLARTDSIKNKTGSRSQKNNYFSGANRHYAKSDQDTSSESGGAKNPDGKRRTTGTSGKSTGVIPWFFQMIFDVINYIWTHRIEALIGLVIVYILAAFLFQRG